MAAPVLGGDRGLIPDQVPTRSDPGGPSARRPPHCLGSASTAPCRTATAGWRDASCAESPTLLAGVEKESVPLTTRSRSRSRPLSFGTRPPGVGGRSLVQEGGDGRMFRMANVRRLAVLAVGRSLVATLAQALPANAHEGHNNHIPRQATGHSNASPPQAVTTTGARLGFDKRGRLDHVGNRQRRSLTWYIPVVLHGPTNAPTGAAQLQFSFHCGHSATVPLVTFTVT